MKIKKIITESALTKEVELLEDIVEAEDAADEDITDASALDGELAVVENVGNIWPLCSVTR